MIAASLVLLLPFGEHGLATAGTDYAPDNRREYVADLKQAAFTQLSKHNATELQGRNPEHSRVSVYVYLPGNDINLESLTVSLNGQRLAQYRYTEAEVAALEGKGRHRILRTNIQSSSDSLLIEFTGTQQPSRRGEVPVQGAVQIALGARQAPRSLLVPLTGKAIGKTLTLTAAEMKVSDGDDDPRLDMAVFLRAGDNKFAALEELLAITRPSHSQRELPPAYHIEVASSYLDFGMRSQAVASMRKALGAGADRSLIHNLSLRLIELDYERRYDTRAYNLLRFLRTQDLTPAQLVRWQDAQSRLLMSAGQFEQACEVLSGTEKDLETLKQTEPGDPLIAYMRFNFAICLIKTDEVARGWWLMERLGQINDASENLNALRDRANLLLGYNFLATAQDGLVRDVLRRVRLQGPFRAEALLALGWMELAAENEAGNNRSEDRITPKTPKNNPSEQQGESLDALQFNPFGGASLQPGQSKQLNAAMVAWQEVVQAFPLDVAGQEAIVAIAFAKGRLGQEPEALSAYQQAVAYLERSHRTLSGYAQSGHLNLDEIAEGNLHALPDATWVARTLASNNFQEHLQNHLLLKRLLEKARDLPKYSGDNEKSGLSEATNEQNPRRKQRFYSLISNLEEQIGNQADLAKNIYDEALAKQIRGLEEYIVAARVGVALFEE